MNYKFKKLNFKLSFGVFLLFIAVFYSCKSKAVVEKATLDFNEYYSYVRTDTIYPSAKQIELLKTVMPKASFQPVPNISNREYWDKIAASKSGEDYLEKALSELEKEPEVPISDEIYRRANLEGNRGIYKPRYYRTMERLENFILAECIENKGRFVAQIDVYLRAIMAMKSWLHPNHDDNNNGVLEGKRVSIDLGARKFGTDLALAEVLLGDKLSDELRVKVAENVKRRITDTYLKSCEISDRNNKWIKSTSNWNSVCTSGTVFSIISSSKSADERIAAIGSALNSMQYYLSGFGDDGYCSEGAGYWGYGFGHYLYLAQILYDYTDGKINLFEGEYPEKLKNVGSFPERYQIQKGTAAPFSDGSSSVSNKASFTSIMSYLYLDATKPLMGVRELGSDLKSRKKGSSNIISDEAAYQLIAWDHYESFIPSEDVIDEVIAELPDYTNFNEFGMVISRGKQDVPFSIAIKAGHNDENHNHMDVGTYTIVLDRDFVSGDIGAPSYRAGAFSDNNPARSSWGHPVPRIDNTLQSKGIEFSGKITATEFKEGYDKVVIDIKAAYKIPSLTKLVRTMENNKSGNGTITVTDTFSSTKPNNFGTAIMTLSNYEVIDANTIILTSDHQKVKVEVSSNDGTLKIIDELVPVKHLREGGPAYRIGVDFTKPIKEGTINVKYIPLF